MNKNECTRKNENRRNAQTAPAVREITVGTLVDLFYLKSEVDAAYNQHVYNLEVIITTYRDPECGMLLKDDTIAYIVDLVQGRGYNIFKDETLLGSIGSRRIVKVSFNARIGAFPNWALPADRPFKG